MSDQTIPRDLAEMATRNIDLAGQLLQEILADPSILDEIPDGATVVPMPFEDPELARHNAALLTKLMEENRNVVVRRVGVPMPDLPAWRATEQLMFETRMIAPHWPEIVAPEPGDLIIVYDRDRDILLVDVFGLRREGIGYPMSRQVAARDDLESGEIVGYLLLGFLASVVLRAPHLTSLLRVAAFRAISGDELGGLIPPEVSRPGPDTERKAAEALANEFSDLIA